MNFLSHYYLSPKGKNEFYTLGVLLPDLIPGFTKIFKQKLAKEHYTVYETEIGEGIAFHLKTDAIFHNLQLFEELTHQVTSIFSSEKKYKIPRSFFIAHVLVELLIDKFLVEKNPKVGDKFYQEIEKVKHSNILAYLDKLKYSDNNFISKFDNFKNRRFAFLLQNNENIYEALKHICFQRIQFVPTDEEKILLLAMIESSKSLVANEWENIIMQMQRKLIENDN